MDIALEMLQNLFKAGVMDVIDKEAMRTVETLCLPTKRPFSQAVFAAISAIGKTTVPLWEQGLKKPGGTAQRLLDLIDRKGLAVLG